MFPNYLFCITGNNDGSMCSCMGSISDFTVDNFFYKVKNSLICGSLHLNRTMSPSINATYSQKVQQ